MVFPVKLQDIFDCKNQKPQDRLPTNMRWLFFILFIAAISSLAIADPDPQGYLDNGRSSMDIPGKLRRLIEWVLGGFGAGESEEVVITVEQANDIMVEAIKRDEDDDNNPCDMSKDGVNLKFYLCCVVYTIDIDNVPLNTVFQTQEMCCRFSQSNSSS